MPDARHKKYPRGPAHPKLQVTPKWKALVKRILLENEKAGRSPANPTELARAVGAHKTGMIKMLDGEQPSYKYTLKICALLNIDLPMIDNPSLPEDVADKWPRIVADMRALPDDQQRQAMAILETFIRRLDER